MIRNVQEVPVPPGTRCEVCGMLAVKGFKDQLGVVHYYCEHDIPPEHQPKGKPEEQEGLIQQLSKLLRR